VHFVYGISSVRKMASNVANFLNTFDVHYLYQCTKEELYSIAEKYGLSLKSVLKEGMQKELVEALVSKEVLSVGDNEGEDERNDTPEDAHGLSESETLVFEKYRYKMECDGKVRLEKEGIQVEIEKENSNRERENSSRERDSGEANGG